MEYGNRNHRLNSAAPAFIGVQQEFRVDVRTAKYLSRLEAWDAERFLLRNDCACRQGFCSRNAAIAHVLSVNDSNRRAAGSSDLSHARGDQRHCIIETKMPYLNVVLSLYNLGESERVIRRCCGL